MYPTDRKYTKEHEWVRIQGTDAAVGLTDFAQGRLGEIVAIHLPEIGRLVAQGEVFGTVESADAVAELFSPLSGEIVAVNGALAAHPGSINATPHDAWMIRLRLNAPADAEALLESAAYSDMVVTELGWGPGLDGG